MVASTDYENDLVEEDIKPDVNTLENDISEDSITEEDFDFEKTLENGNKIPYLKWHDSINKNLRLLIKSEIQQENFKGVFLSYLKTLKENLPFLLRYPKRCRCVAKKMSRILLLFKSLYSNTTEIDLYNPKMCELLSLLTILELKYASNFDELKIDIAKRLCINYNIHLKNLDESHILKVFLYLYLYYTTNKKSKKICTIFDQTEVLTKIFEKYLKHFKNTSQTKINDKLYCMYIVAFYLWMYIETDIFEKSNIIKYANQVIAPRDSLRSNAHYAPFLPKYQPDEVNITKTILEKGFNRIELVKALLVDDSYEDVVINLCEEPQQQIIEIDLDIPEKELDKLQINEVKPELLEKSFVVEMIDLTKKIEDSETKNCPWLSKLIKLARQAKKNPLYPSKNVSIIEIINLDDSDVDEESEEENEKKSLSQKNDNENIENSDTNIATTEKETFSEEQVLTNSQEKESKEKNSNQQNENLNKIEGVENKDSPKSENEEIGKEAYLPENNSNEENLNQQPVTKENNKILLNPQQENERPEKRLTPTILDQEKILESETQLSPNVLQVDKNKNIDNGNEDLKDKTQENSSTTKTNEEQSCKIIPIFDEDLSFVANYATKTYSNKKGGKSKETDTSVDKDCETIPNSTDDLEEILENDEAYNLEITSLNSLLENSLLDDSCDEISKSKSLEQLENRKSHSEKIVHRFFSQKKVNFAPLPEKHIANPKNPAKKVVFEKRIRKDGLSSDKIQTSFIPPAGTEAFKLYESQKNNSLLKQSLNNSVLPTTQKNILQKPNLYSTVSEQIVKSTPVMDNRSISPAVSMLTTTNPLTDSRPTASSILAATGVKSRGGGCVSGTPYVMNRNSPDNLAGIHSFMAPSYYQSIIYKPNFYDYSHSSNFNESPISWTTGSNVYCEKPMSDFDLYLLKLRESRREIDERKKQRKIKREMEKLVKNTSVKKSASKKRKTVNNSDNKSTHKSCCVRIEKLQDEILNSMLRRKRKKLSSTSSIKELITLSNSNDDNKKNSFDNLCINNICSGPVKENLDRSSISDTVFETNTNTKNNEKEITICNKTDSNNDSNITRRSKSIKKKHKLIQKEDDFSVKNTNHKLIQKEDDFSVKDTNHKLIQKEDDFSVKNTNTNEQNMIKLGNIENNNQNKIIFNKTVEKETISSCDRMYNNVNFSYETLENIVGNVENLQTETLICEDNIKLHDEKAFSCRQVKVKLKRQKLSKTKNKILENNSIIELDPKLCENIKDNINFNNSLQLNDSETNNVAIESEIISPGIRSPSLLIHEKITESLNNVRGDVTINRKTLSITTPEKISVVEIATLPDLSDSNVQNSNEINTCDCISFASDNKLSPIVYKSSPKSDSSLKGKHIDNELESIFKIKENEVTSTQESEVSSSLDLRSPIAKRRKSCKSLIQDEFSYSKDFALDCDETASNAPTTTTIIDFVVTAKKRRRRQKKLNSINPAEKSTSNASITSGDDTKLINKEQTIIDTKIKNKKENKGNINKLNKKIEAKMKTTNSNQLATKTYSKNNLVSTVFVPPDIEEMIHKDIESQELGT